MRPQQAGESGKHPNSLAAAASITAWRRTDCQRVYRYVQARGAVGATADEIEVALGGKHQSTSARVDDLKKAGALLESGRSRPTRSGRRAAVLVAEPRFVQFADAPVQGNLRL